MAIRTYNFTFDVKRSIMPEPVFIRQNDSTGATLINVHLVDNGVPVKINGGLEFRAMTADSQNVIADTTGFSNIDIDKGTFSYALPNQLSMTPGKIRIAYFMMVDASGNASTLSFVIFVKPSADLTPSGAKNYISIIDGLIKAFNEWNETSQSSWKDFVNANKEIIESIDPGGKVLSELIDFRHSDMLSKTFDTAKLRGDFYDQELESRGVNVKWFGAVGDGVTDDTAAFVAAFVAATNSKECKTIYIPSGNYIVNTTAPLVVPTGVVVTGDNRWSSIVYNISTNPIFELKSDTEINNLSLRSKNPDATSVVYIHGISLDAVSSDAGIRHCDIRGTGTAGAYKTTGIFCDMNATAFWNINISDNDFRDVYDGIHWDLTNRGWSTANTVQNNVIHGYTHSAIEIGSSDNNMRQFSQSSFSDNVAQLYNYSEDAVAYRIAGFGNNYHNLTYFKDASDRPAGAADPAAIEFSNPTNDPQGDTQFNVEYTTLNRFDGGLLEGPISDPDGVYKYQSFNDVKINYTDQGIWTGMKLQSAKAPNLLSDQVISNYDNQSLLTIRPTAEDSTCTTGSDEYGSYIEIYTGSGTTYLSEIVPTISARNGIANATKYMVGMSCRFIEGKYNTFGFAGLSYTATNSNVHSHVRIFRQVKPNGMIEFGWNNKQDPTNRDASLTDDINVTININAGLKLRIYRIVLTPTMVGQFDDIALNMEVPTADGGYNYAISNGSISSTGTAADDLYKSMTVDERLKTGAYLTISVNISAADVEKIALDRTNVAYGQLLLTYEDGSEFNPNVGLLNLGYKSFNGRVSKTVFVPNGNISSATAGLAIRKGAIGNITISDLQIETGVIPHDYRPNPAG